MGPIAQALFPLLQTNTAKRSLFDMMHVHVDSEMTRRISSLNQQITEPIFEGTTPSEVVFVDGFFPPEIEGTRGRRVGIIASRGPLSPFGFGGAYQIGDVYTYLIIPGNPEGKRVIPYVSYTPRSATMHLLFKDLTEEDWDAARSLIGSLDLLFAFMTEPRFVRQEPMSKLRRNMAAKKMGVPALRNTWTKLSWTMGSATRAKRTIPGSAPQKAFHMVRGHWRQYDHQTPKGERRPHREGWWVWIDAHYSGNPALGEIKHHYMPKLEDPGKSSAMVHGVIASKIAHSTEKSSGMTNFFWRRG